MNKPPHTAERPLLRTRFEAPDGQIHQDTLSSTYRHVGITLGSAVDQAQAHLRLTLITHIREFYRLHDCQLLNLELLYTHAVELEAA